MVSKIDVRKLCQRFLSSDVTNKGVTRKDVALYPTLLAAQIKNICEAAALDEDPDVLTEEEAFELDSRYEDLYMDSRGSFSFAQAIASAHLRVIALTDLHGQLAPKIYKTADEKEIPVGGAALLSAYIQRIRETAPGPVLILDGGDLFQGTLISNATEGKPVIKFYNTLGLAAAAVGNHEFDYGPQGPDSVPTKPRQDPRGAIKARAKEAAFPFLSANILNTEGKAPAWLKKSVIINIIGEGGAPDTKVGIVGATTTSTPETTVGRNLTGLTFPNPGEHVMREARKLREQGADFVLLTIHAGERCEDHSSEHSDDFSSCSKGELMQLLKKLPENLFDAIIGGHSHGGMFKRLGNTAIIQTFSRGQVVGWVDLSTDKTIPPYISGPVFVCGARVLFDGNPTCEEGAIRKYRGSLLPAEFMGEKMVPDGKVVELLKPDFERLKNIEEMPLGIEAKGPFVNSYFDESPLGNLVADMLSKVDLSKAISGARLNTETNSKKTADIGMSNNGGIRANLDKGPLNYGHLFNVFPFDNRLALFEINGDRLRKMVELGISRKHGGLSWSGIRFTAENCRVKELTVGDRPLDENRRYKILSNDFLAGGGIGFDSLGIQSKEIKVLDELPNLRDAVVKELMSYGAELEPADFFTPENARQRILSPCHQE